ncbi:MAG TPA: aromatic amino acid lyase [Caulobacteraceae bacterium]|nr:aromatic amino acid lyase [Caulobacteraceae bacterium]
MALSKRLFANAALGALMALGTSGVAGQALAAYHPITPTMADKTVTLTGRDLTVDEVVQVARYGAKVRLSPEAKQRAADTWGLMMQGSTEGMAIYLFNRGGGSQREITVFSGDPMSKANEAYFEDRNRILPEFKATASTDPVNPSFAELDDEDVNRAIMVVRLNQMTYLPASPQYVQAITDLINAGITPVMRARGGTGEALGPTSGNITTTVRGGGEAYYKGERMSSAEALRRAGLKPTRLLPGDATTGTVNADVAGMGALLVADAKSLLDWIDLVYAMDLNGMNSSVTPLFSPVQANRPYRWINWNANRVLNMMRGSYLFEDEGNDPKIKRIIQDPESLRAGYVRSGAAWQQWSTLKDDVTLQMNWSEHNPAVKPDTSPSDSWELATPWALKNYVKGGPQSNGKHGFIFSNANWDPYPLNTTVEAFTIALANLDVAVLMRQQRFQSTFFTVVTPEEILGPAGGAQRNFNIGAGSNVEVYQRIQGLINPVPPEGLFTDPEGVEELDAEGLFKLERAQRAVLESWTLVANDFATGARWMDIRKAQRPTRNFGPAPTAALAAYKASGQTPYNFIRTVAATKFYPGDAPMPGSAEPAIRALDNKR